MATDPQLQREYHLFETIRLMFQRLHWLRGTVGYFVLALSATFPLHAQQKTDIFSTPELSLNQQLGSSQVPMDSWVYPALERLANLGLIVDQQVGIRPWTRRECLRQVIEAEQALLRGGVDVDTQDEAERLLPDLGHEFREVPDSDTAALDSAYVRYGVIAGPALSSSFFFGQTWWNDYGRPLGRGSSVITGFSARATRGRFFFALRQEGQRDPGSPALTASGADLLTGLAYIPTNVPGFQAQTAQPAYLRGRPLSLYAGVAFARNALSFGKQELYWGPGTMGPLSFSRNAEPTYNLRFQSTSPHPLPLVPGVGTYSFDLVFGKLSGHRYPARPYFNGGKINFVFKNTLEVGFTRWSVLFGQGHPMTLASLERNLFSANSTGTGLYGDRLDPGDRKSGFDFRLHIPGLHHLVTLYADSYADDELNPLAAPRRVAWNPGIYLARLPGLPHSDLRVEAVSTEELAHDEGGGRFFTNNNYLDSNTNKGFLLGTAAGRDARAIEVRTGYWLSSRSRLEGSYRQLKGGTRFLPGGSTISDAALEGSYALNRHWTAGLFFQQERFLVPATESAAHWNSSGRFQLTWTPTDLWTRVAR